jgi:ribosomal protein S6--L-glutamate ligase
MRIAVLSRDTNLYSTSRLVEAGRAKGHEVIVLDHLKCYVVIEGGNPSIRYNGKPVEHIDAVIPRIGNSVTTYGVAIVRQFEMMKVFSTAKSQAIARSRNKLRSLQVLSGAGVDLPKTAFANHPRDIEDLIQQVGGTPVIIKLLEGTQGIGVMLAETPKAAKSVIEAFYGMKANILIQEFISESKGADIRALVVGGKVVGAMKRQGKEGEFRSNLHRGGNGVAIRLSKREKETALAAAKALGLDVAGVDMLQSKRGPLIMEVNSSPGLQGIETSTGIDVAGSIIRYIETHIKANKKDLIGV